MRDIFLSVRTVLSVSAPALGITSHRRAPTSPCAAPPLPLCRLLLPCEMGPAVFSWHLPECSERKNVNEGLYTAQLTHMSFFYGVSLLNSEALDGSEFELCSFGGRGLARISLHL